MWKYYAILSAFFTGLTAILAKCGVKGIDSNLATAVRTTVIMFLVWGIVIFNNLFEQLKSLTHTNLIFLILSGIATGLSWLFYFKALQIGDVSKVAPIDKFSIVFAVILGGIILHEHINLGTIAGCLLILAGTITILCFN